MSLGFPTLIGFTMLILQRHLCLQLPILGSDRILHSTQAREPEVDRQQHLSSEITARKSTIVHLVCVIIMYTIYEM